MKIDPASRTTSTYLSDIQNLKSSLASWGATVDLQLVGTSSLYLRFSLPSAPAGQRQAVLQQIEKLPLVSGLVSAASANFLVPDIATLASYGPNDFVPESRLRGFRDKRPVQLPDLTQPHTDEILIKYLQSAAYTPSLLASARSALQVVHKQLGATAEQTLQTTDTPVEVVSLAPGTDMSTALLSYQNSPVVEYAQPNYISQASVIPNDPAWSGTPYSTSGYNMWNMSQISAPTAWGTATNFPSPIAVTDTGIDPSHSDLNANLWPGNANSSYLYGFNEVTPGTPPLDDNNATPMAPNIYHGSHVSGIIGAVGNNGIGVTGAVWSTRLMAVKVLDSTGAGTDSRFAAGIGTAANNGASVINASWGFSYSNSSDFFLQGTYQSLLANGNTVFVKAAGNLAANNDSWPEDDDNSNFPNILYVGASDIVSPTNFTDTKASFSDFGQYTVDLFAPGVNVWSAYGGSVANNNGGSPSYPYEYLSGTSMAAPEVAGVVALAKTNFPWETPVEIADRIRFSTDSASSLNGYCWTGGRLNAASAINGARPLMSSISTRCSLTAPGTANTTATSGFFIEGGPAGSMKTIAIVALGPSLKQYGLLGTPDPQIALHNGSGTQIDYNDNWTTLSQSAQTTLINDGIAPGNGLESALIETLPVGAYTVVLSDASNNSGIGLIELIDLDGNSKTRFTGLSTLSYCGTGNNAQIAGIIVSGHFPRTVFIHAWGQSLLQYGFSNALNGTTFSLNGNASGNSTAWGSAPTALQRRVSHQYFATPSSNSDGIMAVRLNPGAYTIIVSGANNSVGTGQIEIEEF